MTSRPRLPSNVIAGLEDAVAIITTIWPALTAASTRAAERYQDPLLLADLGRITRGLAVIEHHLRNARQGRYQERNAN